MQLRHAHVCLATADLAACERFYCDVLGGTKRFRFLKDGREIGLYVALGGGTFIEIFHDPAVRWDAGNALRHFCLETDDIDAVHARLVAAGCAPTAKKLGADHSWQVWVSGPDGVRFEFHQYTPESTQRTGADCIVDW